MTIFRDLLSIKSFRENKAELAVHKQRTVLLMATEQRDADERTLQTYRDFAIARERALFDDLCTRTVKLRDIEDVQVEVVVMRSQEQAHGKTLEQAENYRETQSEELKNRRDEHATATRMKEKFVELAKAYADEELRGIERKEDGELEEAAEVRRERMDWDGAEQGVTT